MIKRLMILLLVLLSVGLVMAQEAPVPLAVEYQGNLYVLNTLPESEADLPAALTLISDQIADNYFSYNAVWSPDGTKLAYTEQGKLWVWDGQQSIELVSDRFATDLPISWTRDGLIVYLLLDPAVPVNGIEAQALVYTIAPEAGAQPDLMIRELPINIGCGIGTTLPMEGQLWHDTTQSELHPIVALTDYGLIYPADCGGGISLFRPFSLETIPFNGSMSSAAVSRDEMQVAGIVQSAPASPERQLAVVSLVTMEEALPVTTELPSVLAWGDDGSLYYGAVSATRNLLDDLTPEQMALVETVTRNAADSGFFNGYTVRIYRHEPDGDETLLHEQDAFGVGRLAVKGNTIIYSTVPNGDAWVQAIVDGTLTGDNVYFGDAYQYVSTSVNYLTLDIDGTVAEAGTLPGDLWRVAVPD